MTDDKLVQIHPYRGHDELPREALVIPICDNCIYIREQKNEYGKRTPQHWWRCAAYGYRYVENLPISKGDGCERWTTRRPRRSLLRWLFDLLFRWEPR